MDTLINELLILCTDTHFNINRAEEIARKVNLNQDISDLEYPTLRTSFLTTAIQNDNVEMVRILLQSGADPNYILYEDRPGFRENPFWDLQYSNVKETEEARFQIAQLMLEYGADSSMVLDDEDLFSYICFSVFNDFDDPFGLDDYRRRFFTLLVAYGGSGEYCKPRIIGKFDKTNMAQYQFRYEICDDGYHLTGNIVNSKNEIVAII